MFDQAIYSPLYKSELWAQMLSVLETKATPCGLFGVADGQKAYLAAALAKAFPQPLLVVASHDEHAARIWEDLSGLLGEETLLFPARPVTFYRAEASSREMTDKRLHVLGKLALGHARVVVAPVEALLLPLPPRAAFVQAVQKIEPGQSLAMDGLAHSLALAGYRREERVEGPGQFAVRGGIFDIFPVGRDDPVRVEFFGDEVDGIRAFDPYTQRSLEPVAEAVCVYPATETPLDTDALELGMDRLRREGAETVARLKRVGGSREDAGISEIRGMGSSMAPWERIEEMVAKQLEQLAAGSHFDGIDRLITCFYPEYGSLLDYIPGARVLLDEPGWCAEKSRSIALERAQLLEDSLRQGRALPSQGKTMLEFSEVLSDLCACPLLAFQSLEKQTDLLFPSKLTAGGRGMHTFRGQFDLLRKETSRWKREGFRVLLMAGGPQRAKRLQDTLLDYDVVATLLENDREAQPSEIAILPLSISAGFECAAMKFAVVAEREIYGATRQHQARKRSRAKQGLDLFTDLNAGDFIVHEAFGIGQYLGLIKRVVDGVPRDFLQIAYRDEDMLFVPTDQMDRVQKYIGGEGKEPRVNRLGGSEWKNTRSRAQKHIEDIAEDLVKLYAQRQAQQGFAFSADTDWQRQFEDSFPFEETADQLQCIEEIKRDMEAQRVMDRLLCGDVGYGKTEVALRAIMKAVMDHKQVAFLAPTTILAHQHFSTMKRRFDGIGVNIEVLSRFRSAAEVRAILKRIEAGEVDVVAGTHRLLSKDVVFKDLGLLVVDEEQRFGVSHKERIKQMKSSVDVLTLTATPIPRTLHMSMVGIRDISVIDTPPEERYPVQTFVVEYDEGLVRDAILREMERGGQVFVVYNKVQSMHTVRDNLQRMLPEARIAMGHGQMDEHQLEQVMMDFVEGHYDILLSTTIIENGLDIPRANTLIVMNADHFGLSQLYQLRGRVGRSDRLAYAYFTYRRDKELNEVAQKRLVTIREFTDFGSGFRIALRDLEIRGAGNLLGAEQSGHMTSIGYGLYCRLVEKAVQRLRGEKDEAAVDTSIDLKLGAHIPESYIRDGQDRLDIYRHIAAIRTPEQQSDVTDELIDRFGEIPESVLQLMEVASLRVTASQVGIQSIKQQPGQIIFVFASAAHLDPAKLIQAVTRKHGRASLTATEPPQLRLRLIKTDEKSLFLEARRMVDELAECLLEGKG